jgi:hypothetical protein
VIVVWGIAEDSTTASVLERLDRLGASVLFLDQRSLLGSGLHDADLDLDLAGEVLLMFTVEGRRTRLRAETAGFLRPYDSRAFPGIAHDSVGSALQARATAFDDVLWTWADLAPGLVVNRPSHMAANGSKPFQSRQIAAAGFSVPQTLLTTDAEEAVAFWERHRDVIYKSISGVRSVVARFAPEDVRRLPDLTTCPVQFQARVGGTDYRVHVVGDEIFAARVISDAHDYRYAARTGATVELRTVDLPDDVATRCAALSRAQGLPVSGIDLRLSPGGEWYCFEVNPAPAFSCFDPDGTPIADAVARLLIAATRTGTPYAATALSPA